LYVATPDSGAREAVAFWAAAQVTGLAFAAPAAFPWTLVNSTAGRISLELGVTGPCTTLVGGDDAVDEAAWLAAADVAEGVVQRAIVVRLAALSDPSIAPVDAPARFELSVRVLDSGDVDEA
jgi:3-oxoacyl-[acyl-carrier-protein] synthase II